MAVGLGCLDQLLDLVGGQLFTGAQLSVWGALIGDVRKVVGDLGKIVGPGDAFLLKRVPIKRPGRA
jgi:hypothetical protein